MTRKKLRLEGDDLIGANGRAIELEDEEQLYRALGMQWIPPELREGQGETKAASAKKLPALIDYGDIAGVLHCHSQYSDGTATIEEMAEGAKARGWSYIGISDHSQAAFYAGGLKPEQVLKQHKEIDRLNRTMGDFRILKGIEADILAEGRVDYEPDLLERFDFVIGSIHGRFKMTGDQMTERVLKALDDPFLTILGHPTGRLLLSREPYALDVEAVLTKAKANGIAVELNADPHRLDLDWRYLKRAKELGVTIEIGPDAHSVSNLDFMRNGIGIARKGWLERSDVLNTRTVDDILEFARRAR
jgi:DNA polymerase (family 10)